MAAVSSRLADDLKRALTILRDGSEPTPLRVQDVRWVFGYVRPHLRGAAAAAACMALVALLGLVLPLASKTIVDRIVPARDVRGLAVIALVVAAAHAIRPVLSFLATYRLAILGQSITTAIREDLFRHLLRLPLQYFDKTYAGYLVARLGEVNTISPLFSSAVLTPLLSTLELITSAVIMVSLDWRLSLALVPFLCGILAVGRLQARGIRAGSRSVLEQGAVVSRHIQESISGVHTIKEHGTEERESGRIALNLQRLRSLAIVQSVATALAHESVSTLAALSGVVVLCLGAVEMIAGRLTLGGYLAFSLCAAKVLAPVQVLAMLALALQPACAGLRRLADLRDAAEDDEEARTCRLPARLGRIVCSEVHFEYPGAAGVQALNGLTLSIEPGEAVAIVGASGSGKSTLVRLLLGLYAPMSGSITIGGVDLGDVKRRDLRDRIAIVSQRTFLFHDTVGNNIRYSRPDASLDEIVECARAADAHDFIMQLPQGYDTVVGDRGAALSGGQAQRLSIARALLKKADVLIFDEAASNVDPASERTIWQRASHRCAERTRILVSHRPSSIARADRVIFVDRGRVVATGTHTELSRANARYRALLAEADAEDVPSLRRA